MYVEMLEVGGVFTVGTVLFIYCGWTLTIRAFKVCSSDIVVKHASTRKVKS